MINQRLTKLEAFSRTTSPNLVSDITPIVEIANNLRAELGEQPIAIPKQQHGLGAYYLRHIANDLTKLYTK